MNQLWDISQDEVVDWVVLEISGWELEARSKRSGRKELNFEYSWSKPIKCLS